MESRIHNKRKMKQLIDFKGCAVDGGMYPTDIDGVIEYKDSKYIIFEVKYGDSEIPIGQRLALQRMVDDFTKSAYMFSYGQESKQASCYGVVQRQRDLLWR